MDKKEICEALYALPGDIVVKRRKSQLVPAVLFILGAALIVVNSVYASSLSANVSSALVFIGGVLAVTGMIMAAMRAFGSSGVPFHKKANSSLVYDELYLDRTARPKVVTAIEEGGVDRLLGMDRAKVPALTVAIYRTPDNRFAAMQAFEYADLEYKQITGLKIVDNVK
ncbi:hypothetical protein [uncultured Alistipes sp.]|jgi:hypothetical protein|uniref:hypothetical protein n=1 Tax=uncultured Alistipes sp. TaxID=538949 RepID=UPI0025D7877A|nr:hypothetical protein [uncultured Alistipes sp.]